MKQIFVNLKRFEVARRLGGVCPGESPQAWIEWVIDQCVRQGLGQQADTQLTLLLPEALIIPALNKLNFYDITLRSKLAIGCQGVYREDISPQSNFGAFTANRPATAIKALGCSWALVGHSEERKDKIGVIEEFLQTNGACRSAAAAVSDTVGRIINQEVIRALAAGLNVLVCIGETALERGDGAWNEQRPHIEAVLRRQLAVSLHGVEHWCGTRQLVIGYEPIWAIGPGKTPPDAVYVAFVAAYIKQVVQEMYGFDPVVVYGGGLKAENAGAIAKIPSIGGGLVALTRFTGEIGFYPDELKIIVDKYLA